MDISPILKSVDSVTNKNYRLVIILNCVSRLFEKLTHQHLNLILDDNLGENHSGYRRGNTKLFWFDWNLEKCIGRFYEVFLNQGEQTLVEYSEISYYRGFLLSSVTFMVNIVVGKS